MDVSAILGWFGHQNWFILAPALIGYLNMVVAGARVMGWTQLADFCGKLEDAIQAMFNVWINRKQGGSNAKVSDARSSAPSNVPLEAPGTDTTGK